MSACTIYNYYKHFFFTIVQIFTSRFFLSSLPSLTLEATSKCRENTTLWKYPTLVHQHTGSALYQVNANCFLNGKVRRFSTDSLSYKWVTNSYCVALKIRQSVCYKHVSKCHKSEPNNSGQAENSQRKCAHISP